MVDFAEEISREFNKFFNSVFTNGRNGGVPEADWVFKEPGNDLCDINITERMVSEQLDRLRDDHKVAGSHDLLRRFLNAIRLELACPLLIQFTKVLSEKNSAKRLEGG